MYGYLSRKVFIKIRVFYFILLLFSFKVTNSQVVINKNAAFKPGEELVYNVHYGIVNAAIVKLEVDENYKIFNSRAHYFVSAISKTYPTWDWFYYVRDEFYSAIDTATLFPTYAIRDIWEQDYRTRDNLVFNRNNNTVNSNGKTYNIPDNLFDILSAVYYARCIDFSKIQANKEVPINSFFDNEQFPVGLVVIGNTVLNTKLGKFKCFIIKPKLVPGRIFKEQHDMTLYVTDDLNHLIIRAETAIFVGFIHADLISFKNLKYPLLSKIE